MPHHVAHHERHAPVLELERVVPVAADAGAAPGRQVAGRDRQALDRRQPLRQQAALQRLRDSVLALVDLAQALLHRPPLVDVGGACPRSRQRLVVLVARHAALHDPAVLAVVAAQPVLALPAAAPRQRLLPARDHSLRVVGVHAEGPRRAELLLEGPPGEAEPALVHERDVALRVGGPDHHRRAVGQLAEALLAGSQRAPRSCGARGCRWWSPRSPRTRRRRSAGCRSRASSGTRRRGGAGGTRAGTARAARAPGATSPASSSLSSGCTFAPKVSPSSSSSVRPVKRSQPSFTKETWPSGPSSTSGPGRCPPARGSAASLVAHALVGAGAVDGGADHVGDGLQEPGVVLAEVAGRTAVARRARRSGARRCRSARPSRSSTPRSRAMRRGLEARLLGEVRDDQRAVASAALTPGSVSGPACSTPPTHPVGQAAAGPARAGPWLSPVSSSRVTNSASSCGGGHLRLRRPAARRAPCPEARAAPAPRPRPAGRATVLSCSSPRPIG